LRNWWAAIRVPETKPHRREEYNPGTREKVEIEEISSFELSIKHDNSEKSY